MEISSVELQEKINKGEKIILKLGAQWCGPCKMLKPIFEKVGDFDENLYPAYFEDNDYLYRMKLANIMVEKSMKLVPLVMRHSSSINKDPKLNKDFIKNKNYFVDKWGGEPNREKFKKPFNK
jgi:thiol-disulfide isomerase/thioredoxin